MTTLPRPDVGGRASDRHSLKKQRLASVSESESSEEDSSSDEEDDVGDSDDSCERVPLVLSDDSDSDEEKRLTGLLRSRRPKRLSPPKSMTLPNSDVLDCPCCFKPLRRPVFQNKCSFCALPIGNIRCRAMEKVIKTCLVACSNAKYGCKQSTRYGKEVADHEKMCVFAPCSCPVRNCNFVGSYKVLNNHFRATHKRSPGEIMSFVFNSSKLFGLHLDRIDDPVIFQEEKEGDLVVVQGFKGSHGVYVTVKRIAPIAKEIRKLSCSIARLKDHTTLRLGFQVKNVHKVGEKKEQPEDSFMLIPSHMLGGNDLKMQICIGDEHVYTHI
ncbi:unnamed protein product [Eruca vesicaria subsp. sativa]|uniref:SIAH-type domain-containing protein n=1 Tax=Eruca vesicaria subsp. sativa TaxID=29727 RepID=A0ABC8LHR3_ERUVS|nr:unnamed protein product [Eruca vesicaria subsp. sativa]